MLAQRMAFFAGHGVEPIEEMRREPGFQGLPGLGGRRAGSRPADASTRIGRTSARGEWRWLETGGHAHGHLCLHAAQPHPVLIAGDQVLPTISPNVGLTPLTPDPNPLATYLQSLERLSALDATHAGAALARRPFVGTRRARHRDPPAS